MGQITLKNLSEDTTKEELLEILKHTLSENQTVYEEKELMKMYGLCCQVYDGIKRYSDSKYVTHPLHVAVLLADMEAEEKIIYAGMFRDALRKGLTESRGVMREDLPPEIWKLVKEVNECSDVREASDENVLLIKLAERLHNMRTIEFMDENEIKRRSQETFEIFLPAARKLGVEKLISAKSIQSLLIQC